MAGNTKGQEAKFKGWLIPMLNAAGFKVYPVENEVGSGMADLILVDSHGTTFAELKSTVASGMQVDFTNFTRAQYDFLSGVPNGAGSVLIVEIRSDPNPDKWVVAVIGKNGLPDWKSKQPMNQFYTNAWLRKTINHVNLSHAINHLGKKAERDVKPAAILG